MVRIMGKYELCLDLGKARVKEEKIRYFPAFKPNTPVLQYSFTLHVDMLRIATDISITNSRDSHPLSAR